MITFRTYCRDFIFGLPDVLRVFKRLCDVEQGWCLHSAVPAWQDALGMYVPALHSVIKPDSADDSQPTKAIFSRSHTRTHTRSSPITFWFPSQLDEPWPPLQTFPCRFTQSRVPYFIWALRKKSVGLCAKKKRKATNSFRSLFPKSRAHPWDLNPDSHYFHVIAAHVAPVAI